MSLYVSRPALLFVAYSPCYIQINVDFCNLLRKNCIQANPNVIQAAFFSPGKINTVFSIKSIVCAHLKKLPQALYLLHY